MSAKETPYDSDVVVALVVGAMHVPECGDRVIELSLASVLGGAGESLRGKWCIRAEDVAGGSNFEMGG